MPTNVFFSPKVRTEQYLYEDIVIEALRMYGQDVYYIPRETVSPDEILNEEYSKYASAYSVEMYIANTDSFEGDGNLLSKFGMEIRDQATFVVSRRRFQQLVSIDANAIREERPREGDLIYLPLSKSLFEIKFVEHEKPFYQLSNLPTYEMQCELFEYSAEKFETGVREVDRFENIYAAQSVFEITGGAYGFRQGEKVRQVYPDGVFVEAEVANFIETRSALAGSIQRQANIYLNSIFASDGSMRSFADGLEIISLRNPSNTGWTVTRSYNVRDEDMFMPHDPLAQNEYFENKAAEILDFSESNPFGDPTLPASVAIPTPPEPPINADNLSVTSDNVNITSDRE